MCGTKKNFHARFWEMIPDQIANELFEESKNYIPKQMVEMLQMNQNTSCAKPHTCGENNLKTEFFV
ncbi:hypothetical protein DQM68_07495 [Leptospira mayottensis]|uniref:Uncharacterized protein n=2 Tax=Leptospira mayottensis TaxID=1137606 RepID=A0AA87MR06_9LEPT|nr:hypothetical protein DQM68_07495 [Leptospira mayottensis]AXR64361.1 hypothetical protein DQM28_09180 [Leptospira mayottensis]AZQ03016.1 hypothetical protein LEP1GSC190_14190 [Leptospira mayottensis 200901116]EKS02125.1 hypothetical protein LEP1GSC125_0939 [Leptospira mayottensis 200901122]TGN17026.1 hypothetical protein EHR03_02875 [Leptospira mayottensis]